MLIHTNTVYFFIGLYNRRRSFWLKASGSLMCLYFKSKQTVYSASLCLETNMLLFVYTHRNSALWDCS